ncbi:MAG: chloride channel protein [Lachnospiraceae bacterium]|nr:chloride channel protein [Lachnospiraceae bacterium]
MKDSIRKHPVTESLLYLLRWTGFALLTGSVGGLLGGLFALTIRKAGTLFSETAWLLYLLPLFGVIIVWLYHISREEKNRGTNMVLSSISAGEKVTVPTGPLIFISTVLSHLGGASVGREGAALQLGGWLGARFSELLKLDERNKRTAIMCGMSALFAALFGTPVAAAIFCIEVISVGVFFYSALIPCVFSAFIGAGVAGWMGVEADSFTILQIPALSVFSLLKAVLLGLLCALLAIVLVESLHRAEKLAKRILPNPYLRVIAAGGLIVLMTVLIGSRRFSGSGIGLINQAMREEADPAAFLLKLLFTALAVAGGFRGGEIVPTLSIGACFGALFGSLTGFPVSLSAACGMIALFAGATNCPIAALLIAMEMFHGEGLPYFAVTVALSFVLSGYCSLYGSQRFAFSKTRLERHDAPTNLEK